MPWFNDGYLLNDHPRLTEITDAIIKATVGFAVARSDTGAIMAEFDSLKAAEKAVNGASITFNVDVNVDLDDEADDMISEGGPADDPAPSRKASVSRSR